MTDNENELAWKLLDRIFGSGEFYIDTFGPGEVSPPASRRLVIDGTDYGASDELLAFVEGLLADRYGDGREPDGYRLEGGRMIPTDR